MKKYAVNLLWITLAGVIVFSGCRPRELETTVLNIQRQLYDEAMVSAEAAIKAYPENAEAWFYWGMLNAEHKKDYAEMSRAFDKVMELNPNQKVSYQGASVLAKDAVHQIKVNLFADNYNGAVKAINNAQNAPDEEAKRKAFEQALEKLTVAIQVAPERPEPYRPLAMTYLNLGDTTQAQQALEKGLQAMPDDEDMTIAAGEVYAMSGNMARAKELFEKALEKNPNNSLLYQKLGMLEAQEKNWDKANEYYQKALEMDPDNADLAYNIGVSYYNRTMIDEAIPYFEKALVSEPEENELTYTILANCYVRSEKKIDDGIKFLEKATQKYPDNSVYWEYLAILYGKKGMAKESEAAFKKSKELKN